MNKILLLLLTALASATAYAGPIKVSPGGIYLSTSRPSWTADPGMYTIRKYNEQISRVYWLGASPSQSVTPGYLTGDSGFSITTDNCGSVVDSSCELRVKFNSSGKANGRYTAVLTVGDLDIPVTAVVGYDKPKYQVTDSMGVEINQVDLNTIFQGLHASITRSFYLKDLNKASFSALTPSVSSPFSVSSSCSASSLNGNTGCLVAVTLSGSSSPASYSGTVTVDTVSIPVVAEVQPIGNRGASSSFILTSSSGRLLSALSFPDSSNTISGIFYLKDINAREFLLVLLVLNHYHQLLILISEVQLHAQLVL